MDCNCSISFFLFKEEYKMSFVKIKISEKLAKKRKRWKERVGEEAKALISLSNIGIIKLPEGTMVKIAKSRSYKDIEKINQEIKRFNGIE